MGSFAEIFIRFVTFEFSISRPTCTAETEGCVRRGKMRGFALGSSWFAPLGIEQRENDGKASDPSSNVCRTGASAHCLAQAPSCNTIARAIALSAGPTAIASNPASELSNDRGERRCVTSKISKTLTGAPEMDAPLDDMDAAKIATCVIKCALEIHKRIGPGRLASTYAECWLTRLSAAASPLSRRSRFPFNSEEGASIAPCIRRSWWEDCSRGSKIPRVNLAHTPKASADISEAGESSLRSLDKFWRPTPHGKHGAI